VACAQRDLKQLLAASTCAQIGIMVLAAGVGSVAGGTAQLVAHAAAKSLLFLAAGAWLVALGTKDLGDLHGAARRYPVVGVTFGVGALALAGLPPLSLWITKDTVLAAAAERSAALYAAGLTAGMLSAAYAGLALAAVWRPADAGTRNDIEQTGTRLVGPLQTLPLPALAGAAAVFGAVGLPMVADAWRRLLGVSGEPHADLAELAVSGALAALTLLAAMAIARRPLPIGAAWTGPSAWLYLERIAGTLVARPVLALAGALARFDDRVIDGGVRAAAAAGDLAATLATRRVEVRVDGVIDAVGHGARLLGDLARQPQTGQAHTYYAQAAVLFVALVLLIVLVG
jgi:NADH:ubiquinone oxidoreductase subunit 5 (subunit L)/multisubunit Na+/H+ antiporter MnhA subunit